LEDHTDWVNTLAFSPEGRFLVSSSRDGTVKLWDTATGVVRQSLEGHRGGVSTLAFSPDSQLLASGSKDGTVKLRPVVDIVGDVAQHGLLYDTPVYLFSAIGNASHLVILDTSVGENIDSTFDIRASVNMTAWGMRPRGHKVMNVPSRILNSTPFR